jgi:VanZ family protein
MNDAGNLWDTMGDGGGRLPSIWRCGDKGGKRNGMKRTKWWDSRVVVWAAPLAWMALIFALSAQSQLPNLTPGLPDLQSIAGHLLSYGILAALWFRALSRARVPRPVLWALLLAVLYGLSDEFHQSFVPGRTPAIFDLVLDGLGAAAAMIIGNRINMMIRMRRTA